ncbi:MAG: dephospho-CoA kinase [Clostridiaceae bacterium]|nr:dephospho-CoA kinase [Clostridiaceae bacterium]
MKIIGVTGGIGSGKSTVSRTLRDLGAAVIDADVLAKNITGTGGRAFNELVEYFGKDILDDDGELDRSKLASIAFGDKVKLHALNSITHKYIADKIHETVQALSDSDKWDIIVIDAPLPIEKGFMDLADEVWVVTAKRETRIKRVMDRSGFTYEAVSERIDSQLRDEEYLRIADEVVENNGTVEELEQAVVKLFLQKKKELQR